jgi:hypothetical protein
LTGCKTGMLAMTRSNVHIGDLPRHEAHDVAASYVSRRARTEQRLGLVLIGTVASLTLAVFSTGSNSASSPTPFMIESKTINQIFDVSNGVRRL